MLIRVIFLGLLGLIFLACGSSDSNSNDKANIENFTILSKKEPCFSGYWALCYNIKSDFYTKARNLVKARSLIKENSLAHRDDTLKIHFSCIPRSVESGAYTQAKPHIEGFDFIWGHTYELEVAITKHKEMVVCGSNFDYKLVKIISDKEDDIGTFYEYNLPLSKYTFFSQDTKGYKFIDQFFTCKADAKCDDLIKIQQNDKRDAKVTFTYKGNGQIELINWQMRLANK